MGTNQNEIAIATLTAAEIGSEAVSRHGQNHNCAQCVACTMAPVVGISVAGAFRLMEGFGGGMGNNSQTCGAISGAVLAISAASSDGYENRTSKQTTYARVSALVEDLKAQFGGTMCYELRPSDPDMVRPTCEGYIRAAAEKAFKAVQAIKAEEATKTE